MRRAVGVGQEDRLALSGVRIESSVTARARLDALHRALTALGSLEDAVQRPLDSEDLTNTPSNPPPSNSSSPDSPTKEPKQ
jgi:hypothetical protein